MSVGKGMAIDTKAVGAFDWLRPLRGVPAWPGQVGRWWIGEFLELFPPNIAAWLAGEQSRRLVLIPAADSVACALTMGARAEPIVAQTPRDTYTPEVLDTYLRSHKLARADVALGLRLPAEQVFTREVILPLEAAGNLSTVVAGDLALNTPFRLDGIIHDHTVIREGERLRVVQWVVPRAIVLDHLAALGEDLETLAFIETDGHIESTAPRPHLTVATIPSAGRPLPNIIAAALAISACILIALVLGLRVAKQQTLLDQLTAELPAAAAKGRAVREAIEKLDLQQVLLARLRHQKFAQPGLLDLWEELSRTLPLDAWATEIRLTETADTGSVQIAINGFSPAAASIVGVLDKSAPFTDTGLTAAISFDSHEQRERFSLRTTPRKSEFAARGAP